MADNVTTVRELIEELQGEDPNMEVVIAHQIYDYLGRETADQPTISTEKVRREKQPCVERRWFVTEWDDYDKYEEDEEYVLKEVVVLR